MADTIREFLVGLGFKIDDSSERRFISSMEGAVLRANLLADAIENMAKIVVEKVGQVASQFEQLYYQSSRVGASAQAIRAFEYAVSQLGGTAEGANSSLESFGRFLRNTPGALSWVAGQLHVQTKDIRGAARENTEILLDIGERLSHMPPYLADRYRQMLGIDEKTLFAIEHAPEAIRRYQESLKSQSGAGITGEAMRQATQFEQAWREVWQRIGNMAEGGELKLLTALTEPMEKFGQWLDKNSPQINSAIDKMASSVSSLTTAWVEDLNKVQWTDVANSIEGAEVDRKPDGCDRQRSAGHSGSLGRSGRGEDRRSVRSHRGRSRRWRWGSRAQHDRAGAERPAFGRYRYPRLVALPCPVMAWGRQRGSDLAKRRASLRIEPVGGQRRQG